MDFIEVYRFRLRGLPAGEPAAVVPIPLFREIDLRGVSGGRFRMEGEGVGLEDQGANYNQLFTARFRLKRNPVLAPGMSVSVTIGFKPSSEAMSIVPVSALFMKDGQSFVWLYNEQDETIEPVSVAVERLTKDGEAIVRSALRKGQTVISAGVNDLKEGQKVKLLPPVPASNVGGLL